MTDECIPVSTAEVEASGKGVDRRREEFLLACAGVFDRLCPDEGQLAGGSFDEIEKAANESARFLAVLLCEKRLALDPLSNPNQDVPCPRCRKRMRIQERAQSRVLKVTVGEVEYQRPYCVCDACGFCCAPLDYALGIPSQGPSIARRELVCHAAAKDRSFEKARCTLQHHNKIKMTDEGVRKLAEAEGRELVKARARRVEMCFNNQSHSPAGAPKHVPFLVVTCDGGMVKTRNREDPWKSDKIGCVYDARPQPDKEAATAEKYHGAKAITKTYVATMEPWEALGRMLFAEACARGYMQAEEKVFISDGAEPIVTLRELHFSDAHAVIDWYHASEHIHHSGKAAFGAGTDKADEWIAQVKDWLWHGQLQDIIDAVSQESERLGLPPKNTPDSDPRVVLHRDIGYFTRNQGAMDYPTYRENGWPIGSGVVEGCVKQFGLRMKGSEKFWNLNGAEEMLALCELFLSEDDRWTDYWQRRAEPPAGAQVLRSVNHAPNIHLHTRHTQGRNRAWR